MSGHRRRLAAGVLLLAALLGPAANGATEATDQHGRHHAWRGEAGRVTVVDFAASWCAPCWRSLPELQKLAKAHPDVRFLVVSVDESAQGRDKLVRQLELGLPVLWDEDRSIAEHYRPEAMPTTVVVDEKGQVLGTFEGSGKESWQGLVALVERLDPPSPSGSVDP